MPVLLESSAAWTAIQEAVTELLSSVTSVFTMISSAAVLPYFAIGIGVAVIGTAVGFISRIVWGR